MKPSPLGMRQALFVLDDTPRTAAELADLLRSVTNGKVDRTPEGLSMSLSALRSTGEAIKVSPAPGTNRVRWTRSDRFCR